MFVYCQLECCLVAQIYMATFFGFIAIKYILFSNSKTLEKNKCFLCIDFGVWNLLGVTCFDMTNHPT